MSNILSTVIKKEMLNTVPKKTIIHYQTEETISTSTDSTALIELEIPGQYIDSEFYGIEPNLTLTGETTIFRLISLHVSSESEDFNIRLLNIDDITKVNTIYEIISIDNIVYSYLLSVGNMDLIIKNKDIPQTNKLYLFVSNSGTIINTINVELVYEIIKNI